MTWRSTTADPVSAVIHCTEGAYSEVPSGESLPGSQVTLTPSPQRYRGRMRIRQYAYFSIHSNVLTPSDITSRLGIEPDNFHVRGSQTENPPVPRSHIWRVKCDDRTLR